MTDAWNPAQYDRFRAERKQPFLDLCALLRPRPGMRVVDLGCGTGDLTRELHERLSAVETLGLDRSAAMLAKAPASPPSGLHFQQREIEDLPADRRWDLVFSNAALHWVQDHVALFSRLAALVEEGGQLAVQMPSNHGHASHRTAEAVAAEPPFQAALQGSRRQVPLLAPEAYASMLHRLGFRDQHVRLQVYVHELPSREHVVEWVKGTLLTDYESRLGPELFPRFLARYREKLLGLLDDDRPFLYTYPRLLIWAQR